jgi:hypothetical protein
VRTRHGLWARHVTSHSEPFRGFCGAPDRLRCRPLRKLVDRNGERHPHPFRAGNHRKQRVTAPGRSGGISHGGSETRPSDLAVSLLDNFQSFTARRSTRSTPQSQRAPSLCRSAASPHWPSLGSRRARPRGSSRSPADRRWLVPPSAPPPQPQRLPLPQRRGRRRVRFPPRFRRLRPSSALADDPA